MSFKFKKIENFEYPQPIIIETDVCPDSRGRFSEVYKQSIFKNMGIDKNFVQFNTSLSDKNVIRGLHYQVNPFAQGKLVIPMQGRIIDVFVDIRKSSKSWLRYDMVELNAKLGKFIYVTR